MMINVRGTLLATSLILALSSASFGQSGGKIFVEVRNKGSAPPVPQWYDCTREFENKRYDQQKALGCLKSILAHPGLKGGKVSFNRTGPNELVTFQLESPPLYLSDVDYGISGESFSPLGDLLSENGDVLHALDVYEPMKEILTRGVLAIFLRSQGRRAGITRTLHLDYENGTAQLQYQIWDGPPGVPQRLGPPYAEACAITILNFNWIDVDDLSPVSFIEREMKTKWFGCFTETDIRDDLVKLREMTFLKELDIAVTGSGNFRTVSMHIRSSPIPIAEITVKGYGLLAGLTDADVPKLPVRVGDVYSQSKGREARGFLERAFAQGGRRVKAYDDARVTQSGELVVDFGILSLPDDQVFINGKSFDVNLPSAP